MNKTETLLWLMRAHEAVRKFPEDAEINGVELKLYEDNDRIRVFLDGPVDVKHAANKTVIRYKTRAEDGTQKDSKFGRVDVLDSHSFVYWWPVVFSDDGTIERLA